MTKFQKLLSKRNKKIIIVGILIFFLFTLFYWFQVRPSHIKANCQKEADEWRKKTYNLNSNKDGLTSFSVGEHIDQATKDKYSFCLHRNGL